MSFTLITSKTVPCTCCGYRVKVNKSATFNADKERVFEFRCPKCKAVFEYAGEFIDRLLLNKEKI